MPKLDKGMDSKSFDKLIKDAMKHLQRFEDDIRADERKKVLAELARGELSAKK